MILCSGHEEAEAPHTEGVALQLSPPAQRALVGWKAHGSHIISASFRTTRKKIRMNVIQCYAPTNDIFSEGLQSVIAKYPECDINILMGVPNAKVVADNSGFLLLLILAAVELMIYVDNVLP